MNWPDSYTHFPTLTSNAYQGDYSLRPIRWEDRTNILQWRNEQLDVLRQIGPLSPDQQDTYFQEIVLPQFAQEFPEQLMFAFLHGSELIGYGALVHIHWGDHRAEISFLTSPERHDHDTFESDWNHYLSLLKPVAARLGLHKLTTETYEIRRNLIPILEANGMVKEGLLKEHHFVNGEFIDSLVHGVIL